MSASLPEARRARAAAEAADWAVRLESGRLSAVERGELVDWLRESPVHVAEMLRIGRLTSALATFDDWDQIPPISDSPDQRVIPLRAREAVMAPPRRTLSARAKRVAGLAAAAVLVAASGWLLRQQPSETAIRTQIGERREVALSDGSVVRLSATTDLRVRFERHTRAVLIE
jgi:transmembrane sensor